MIHTPHKEGNTIENSISRRALVGRASAFLLASPTIARLGRAAAQRKTLAYVGTYSSPQGPEGSKGRGKGIYLFEMDRESGVLTPREVFANDSNPAWLAFSPSRTHLYSANETQTFEGQRSGSVSAYSIEPSSGRLTLLNTVSSGGAGPAHLSVHPSGKYVLVANYAGGTVAVLPVKSNGELGPATDVNHDEGKIGPANAASAPNGSFAISGHDRPHAHMVAPDPSGRYVIASDLGLDCLFVWRFDLEHGKFTPHEPTSISVPGGDGPRHFTFHPNGRWFYSLQEEASTIALFDWDAEAGRLTPRRTISSLPAGFAGTNFTSEIMISADGQFLYAANRLHDSIAWFAIDHTGNLKFSGEEWTRGDYPRSFNIDPTGNFLYSCNQRADALTTFRVNRSNGKLTFTDRYTAVGTPAAIIFLA